MRCIRAFLTFLFVVSLFIVSPAAMQNSAETHQKPIYKPTGNEATLVGSIFAHGKIPESLKLDMDADPVCAELNRPQARTDDFLTSNQGLLNAFVYVKNGAPLNDYSFEVPASEVTLERRGCRFSPHVLALRVGQRLSLVNSDPIPHNTHPLPKINVEWNMTQAAGATPFVQTFTHPEQFIPVKCNHHAWERAIVGVFAHPFFAVSDHLGNYEIRGLPAGTYKLVVWHERLGEKEVEVTVGKGENRRTDFTFEVTEKHRSIQGGSSHLP